MIATRSGRNAARILGGVTAGIGAALLLRPHAVASRTSGGGGTPASGLVRVLGGRQLLQGAAQILRPQRSVLLGGVALDTLHAASMVAVSLWWPLYRRSALTSAAVAGVCAAAATAILVADAARPHNKHSGQPDGAHETRGGGD